MTRKKSDYKIQSILFDRKLYNVKTAEQWLKKNGFQNNGVDEKPDHLRFRQIDPEIIVKQGFSHYITKPITEGVQFIIGYKHDKIVGGKRRPPPTFAYMMAVENRVNEFLDNENEALPDDFDENQVILMIVEAAGIQGNFQTALAENGIHQIEDDTNIRDALHDAFIMSRFSIAHINHILEQITQALNGAGGAGRVGGKVSVKHIQKFVNASYKKDADEHIDDYMLDKSLSNDTAKTYYNPKLGHVVIIHRGTSGAKDWLNNVAYAIGTYKSTNRYKTGKQIQDAVEKKYGAENVSTLGHSQGAVLSRELGKNSKEIINLNPAYKGEKQGENEYNIRSSSDVVSGLLAPINKVKTYLKPEDDKNITIQAENPLNVLKEHSPDILNRLDQEREIGRGISGGNRWTDFVKQWSKVNGLSYGRSLSKPEMRAEYYAKHPKIKKPSKKGAKEEPKEGGVKPKFKENITFSISPRTPVLDY